jgi:hypothetical protein
MLEWVSEAVRLYLAGVQDACNIYWPVVYVFKSKKIQKATIRVSLLACCSMLPIHAASEAHACSMMSILSVVTLANSAYC